MQVKICGITSIAAARAVRAAGADAAGFMFYAPSPRALALAQARELAAELAGVQKVGVFVDADDRWITAAVAAAGLDALQLQGQESPARVVALRQQFGLPVWKAVGVRTAADIAQAVGDFAGADRLLFDARPPAGALPGGNGRRFDWALLRDSALPADWGLAGGLTPANVAEAIAATGAPLVDVSSGVERAPGCKDVAKIVKFVEAARRVSG